MRVFKRILIFAAVVFFLGSCIGNADAALAYTFNSGSDVAVTGSNYAASGVLSLSLGFTPTPGTNLTVVKNTGLSFISGTFSNVPQGGVVTLSYGGVSYDYIANYYGGNGRSLVLQWPCMALDSWGWNYYGQLSTNGTSNSLVPTPVVRGAMAGKTVTVVAGGGYHSMAVTSDGEVFVWGDNSHGQLGDGSTDNSYTPMLVRGALSGKTVIAVAPGFQSCTALTSDGQIFTWGDNPSGDTPKAMVTTGTPLQGKTVVAIAAGLTHRLVLTSDGQVFAWGNNNYGVLGNGTVTSSTTPVAVTTSGTPMAGKTVVAIAAGEEHSMALTSDGQIFTWGDNAYGQLGTNSTTKSSIPVAVVTSGTPLNGKTIVAIEAGSNYSLAIASTGEIFTWGNNDSGELGNSGTTNSLVPVAVTTTGTPLSGKIATTVAGGSAFSVALTSDNKVFAWGNNHSGTLGTGGTTNSLVPVAVSGGSVLTGKMVTSIAAGFGHAFSIFGMVPSSVALNPVSQTVKEYATVSFTAAATGTTSVRWQVSTTGTTGIFSDVTGNASGTTTTLALPIVAAAQNGYAYRAVFTNDNGGSCTTSVVLLNILPYIIGNPVSVIVQSGTTVNFIAATDGNADVQWQVSTTGTAGTFSNIIDNTSATTGTLTLINVTSAQNGYAYRAVFTNSGGTSTTSAATLGVVPMVTTNPVNQVVQSGATVSFTAASDGNSAVQWQVSTTGTAGDFSNITNNASATTGTLTLTNVTSAQNGYAYRAVFTNSAGSCTTTPATLAMVVAPSVSTNPTNQVAAIGSSVSFTAAATGNPLPAVRWQVSTAGAEGVFSDITDNASASTATLTLINISASQDGYAYRAVFSNSGGTCATTAALLTIAVAPVVSMNPVSQTASQGAAVFLSAAATGKPAPSVQWQVSTTGTTGTFSNIVNNITATTPTLRVSSIIVTQNGYAYRAVFTNMAGSGTTNAAVLSVPPYITVNPVDQFTIIGGTASFTAVAIGNPSPTVQWQVSITGTAGPFSNVTANATATTGTLTLGVVDVMMAHSGYAYRAVFSNSGGVSTTAAAVLTFATPPTVTANPVSQTVAPGAAASFTAAASGNPVPTVQWQMSTTGTDGTFDNLIDNSSATTGTLTLPNVTLGQNGYAYRAIFTNGGGKCTTTAAGLTVPIQNCQVAFNSGTDVGLTMYGNIFVSGSLSMTLGFAPTPGTNLTVINNCGLSFINGRFDNVPQSGTVSLKYNGVAYRYIANYYGGNGRSLVLQWPSLGVASWGYNFDGELGIGGTTASSVPVRVSGSEGLASATVIAIAAGDTHSLALTSDGRIFAWGYNPCGQLGTGLKQSSSTPVPVKMKGTLTGKTVVAISAKGEHSMALTSDGQVFAWGRNSECELGNGDTTDCWEPVAVNTSGVLAGKTVVAISAGGMHSMALTSEGQVFTWGCNSYGELGNSGTTTSSVPVAATGVLTGQKVMAISAGWTHSVAVTTDKRVYTWGSNLFGVLGIPTTDSFRSAPASVDPLTGIRIVAISSGETHCMALSSDGQIYTWGENRYGALGNNTTTNSNAPITVDMNGALAGKTVTAIGGGWDCSFALTSDGQVFSWGKNTSGELGNSTTTNSMVPLTVYANGLFAGTKVMSIASGEGFSLGIFALGAPSVKSNPVSQVATLGSSATFTANAADDPGLEIQWQVSTTGTTGPFSDIVDNPTATTGTLTLSNVESLQNGYAYRAVFTTNAGSCETAVATLTTQRNLGWFQQQYGIAVSDPAELLSPTGISLLEAYAFGMNPSVPDLSQMPSTAIQNGSLQISYSRWKDAGDLTYVVEVSSDLQHWYSGAEYTQQISTIPIDATRDQVIERDLSPLSGAKSRFIRVRISQP